MGRPPLFSNAEELEILITEYFESCKYKEDSEGKIIQIGDTITITGLALYLGFESRQSFYDYEKREDFSYIIKKARLQVESSYEKRLDNRNPTGAIFALKNMGWSDKQEVISKTTIEDERIDLTKLSEDELNQLAELQRRGRASQA